MVGGGDGEEAEIMEDRAEPAMALMFNGGVMEGGVEKMKQVGDCRRVESGGRGLRAEGGRSGEWGEERVKSRRAEREWREGGERVEREWRE